MILEFEDISYSGAVFMNRRYALQLLTASAGALSFPTVVSSVAAGEHRQSSVSSEWLPGCRRECRRLLTELSGLPMNPEKSELELTLRELLPFTDEALRRADSLNDAAGQEAHQAQATFLSSQCRSVAFWQAFADCMNRTCNALRALDDNTTAQLRSSQTLTMLDRMVSQTGRVG